MNWEEYKKEIANGLDNFKFDEQILQVLKDSVKNNQKIFVGGNGGSAAIALHYVCDFSKGATNNWKENFVRYKAICLSSNLGYLTAISNDEHYDEVFKQQLINLAEPNDILIMISSSGNSPNIIKAVEWANEHGLVTIGISGFSGGRLKKISKHSAHIDHHMYEVCEDIHHIFGQFLTTYLRTTANDTFVKPESDAFVNSDVSLVNPDISLVKPSESFVKSDKVTVQTTSHARDNSRRK